MNANHPPEPFGRPELVLGSSGTVDARSIHIGPARNGRYHQALLQLSASHRPSLDNAPLQPSAVVVGSAATPPRDQITL